VVSTLRQPSLFLWFLRCRIALGPNLRFNFLLVLLIGVARLHHFRDLG
jgi:hypothetical protein